MLGAPSDESSGLSLFVFLFSLPYINKILQPRRVRHFRIFIATKVTKHVYAILWRYVFIFLFYDPVCNLMSVKFHRAVRRFSAGMQLSLNGLACKNFVLNNRDLTCVSPSV
jgi:hypothetical protein